jgi:hypothetical protein
MVELKFLIFFISTGTVFAGFSQNDIQQMLGRPYEKNADAMMALIRQGRYEDVESFLNYVSRKNIRTRDGFRYFRAILENWFGASEDLEFKRTQPVPMDLIPYLDNWIENRPNSSVAYIIRGVLYIERAWEIRKRGYADTVKKKQWKQFYALHELARRDLEKAYELDPANPHSSRQLIRVQRAENAKDQKATNLYFNRAVQKDSKFYWAYRAKLENEPGAPPRCGFAPFSSALCP